MIMICYYYYYISKIFIITLLMMKLVEGTENVDPPLESKELHFYNEKLNQFVQEYPEFKYLIDKVKAGDKEAKKIFETKSLSKQWAKTKESSNAFIKKDPSLILNFIDNFVALPGSNPSPKLEDMIGSYITDEKVVKELHKLYQRVEDETCDFGCFGESVAELIQASFEKLQPGNTEL